jgi:hypothetical protein
VTRTIWICRASVAAALLAAICVLCAPPIAADADQTVHLTAALTPERLGAGTTIHFGFTVQFAPGQAPVPISQIDLLYPQGLGIATSGLGIATCKVAVLEAQGPPGCPPNSLMGYGSGTVEVPFGPQLLQETARTATFMAPVRNGRIGLLFYANGETPVAAQLVFPGLVLPAADPFGGDLNALLPLVPTLPEAPDAALIRLTTTLGPSHITYFEFRKGQTIPYHPQGILLPPTCPHGGFQFAAHFVFADGTRTSAYATVACPRRHSSRRARHSRH